jgi:hypothetical protein
MSAGIGLGDRFGCRQGYSGLFETEVRLAPKLAKEGIRDSNIVRPQERCCKRKASPPLVE